MTRESRPSRGRFDRFRRLAEALILELLRGQTDNTTTFCLDSPRSDGEDGVVSLLSIIEVRSDSAAWLIQCGGKFMMPDNNAVQRSSEPQHQIWHYCPPCVGRYPWSSHRGTRWSPNLLVVWTFLPGGWSTGCRNIKSWCLVSLGRSRRDHF